MSFLNKVFQSIPVKIPDRSGFDLSHEVLSTAKVGTVTPVTHFEVLPGDTISMGSLMKVTLPPMAVPFMGRIDAELTAAFIPYRLLWAGWQSFITQNNGQQPNNTFVGTGSGVPSGDEANGMNIPYSVPVVNIGRDFGSSQYTEDLVGPGSLLDYLGCKIKRGSDTFIDRYISVLPFLAYHKFCDDWIRDDNNMKPFFPKVPQVLYNLNPTDTAQFNSQYQPAMLPSLAAGSRTGGIGGGNVPIVYLNDRPLNFSASYTNFSGLPVDMTLRLGSLRQRCWAKDYFTTATTRPQAGAASSVVFDTSGNTGQFTIATLRAANSLQKWMERNNIAGTEYGDQIMAHFGVRPPDAVLNRSILLGSVRTPVFVGSVENNTGTGAASGTSSPYGNTLGAAAGFASAADKGRLIDDFTAKEHGIVMVFFTLIPHAYYATGCDRQLLHMVVGDFAWPEFANIGDQQIYASEMYSPGTGNLATTIFGYNQRYSEYKFLPDRISGLLRDGENLDVYALQRSFASSPELGKSFLEIPTTFLDQVLGVDSSVGGFGCMLDVFFDCQALRILPEYSLPSL